MKLFLDSAQINYIESLNEIGIVDGITTNPTIISKEGEDFKSIIIKICNIVDGPVSAEVSSGSFEEMLQEARDISIWAKNIVVKVPMTKDGLKLVKVLSQENIKTNVTLIFSVSQGLLAAKAGATYISPFVGRLDDIGENGINLIKDLKVALSNYNFKTEIIAASIRNVEHIKGITLAGADIATVPPQLVDEMIKHELTTKGLEKFENDWQEYKRLIDQVSK